MSITKLKLLAATPLVVVTVAVLAWTAPVLAATPANQAAAVAQPPVAAAGDKKDGDSKQAEPLKITIELPKDPPTVKAVNKGTYRPTIKVDNLSKEEVVLWPFATLTVLDDKGNAVGNSFRIGRYGLRLDNKSVIEGISFTTLKPGEAMKLDINLPMYTHDPMMMLGWKLPGKGEYTLRAEYKYNRAEVKKDLGGGANDLDNPKQPWNRAVEFEKKVEIKLKVEGDDPQSQARFRDPSLYDAGERLVCHLYFETPERGAAPALLAVNSPERRWSRDDEPPPMW